MQDNCEFFLPVYLSVLDSMSDPLFLLKLLWSFVAAQLGEEDETKPFKLTNAIPGASRNLDYESNLTFGESGLANSMISVTWD
jgi:hypothetical protein